MTHELTDNDLKKIRDILRMPDLHKNAEVYKIIAKLNLISYNLIQITENNDRK
jgi:hypothetical protein